MLENHGQPDDLRSNRLHLSRKLCHFAATAIYRALSETIDARARPDNRFDRFWIWISRFAFRFFISNESAVLSHWPDATEQPNATAQAHNVMATQAPAFITSLLSVRIWYVPRQQRENHVPEQFIPDFDEPIAHNSMAIDNVSEREAFRCAKSTIGNLIE